MIPRAGRCWLPRGLALTLRQCSASAPECEAYEVSRRPPTLMRIASGHCMIAAPATVTSRPYEDIASILGFRLLETVAPDVCTESVTLFKTLAVLCSASPTAIPATLLAEPRPAKFSGFADIAASELSITRRRTPNTKAQPMAKYSTFVVAIVAVVLTVATGATLIELNRRGRAEFDELEARLSDLDAKYQALYRDLRGEMFARNAALRKEMVDRIAQSAK
jgi:hypothetical protein